MDDGEVDINNLQILPGGEATNLDNMDKDQVLRMINDQMQMDDDEEDDGGYYDEESDSLANMRR